jgi:hypothetical protein
MTEGEIRALAFQLCTAAGDEEMVRAVQQLITVADRLLLARGIRLGWGRIEPASHN